MRLVFNGDGNCIFRDGPTILRGASDQLVLVGHDTAIADACESYADDSDWRTWQSWPITTLEEAELYAAVELGQITPTLDESGQVVGVGITSRPVVWLHHAMTGGDGETPPGIPLDGSQALNVSVELRMGQDAASDLIPETPAVAGPWRITLRDQAGAVYDVVRATLDSQGRGDFAYTPPTGGRAARCHLSQADLTTVTIGGQEYKVRLANPAVPEVGHFVVYRQATPAA